MSKLFSVNDANLRHLEDCVEQFGKAWIHGNGNVYVTEETHAFARDYSPPLRLGELGSGSYWAFFDDVDDIPNSVELLKKIFLKNREKQVEESIETKKNTEITVVKGRKPVLTPTEKEVDNGLDAKAKELEEHASKLEARENSLTDWHEKLTSATQEQAQKFSEIEQKEKDLAERERKLQEKLEKLKASNTNNKTGEQPKA